MSASTSPVGLPKLRSLLLIVPNILAHSIAKGKAKISRKTNKMGG